MKIEIEVSELNEFTDSPYWLILDPLENLELRIPVLAGQITGPFFSREEAENHLTNRRHNFSNEATVYCMSGYWSRKYKEALRCAKGLK